MQYQAPAAGSTVLAAAAVSGTLPITGSDPALLIGVAVACMAVGTATLRAAAAMRADQK